MPMSTHLVIRNNSTELPVCPDKNHCLDVTLFVPLKAQVENTKLAEQEGSFGVREEREKTNEEAEW